MQNEHSDDPLNYHDDNRVLRYLLHNVKGLSPVSGGVLGDALEEEYKDAETEFRPELGVEFESEV